MTCAVLLVGCGGGGTSDESGDTSASNASTSEQVDWLLDEAPSEPKSVRETKASAHEGDTVIVHARIGGRTEPMSEGSAVFTVMDMSIPHCGENGDDLCPKPWDYCCETPESIKANAATVRLVANDGSSVSVDPRRAGLKELDEIIIVGTVGPRPTNDVLTILATGVHRMTP